MKRMRTQRQTQFIDNLKKFVVCGYGLRIDKKRQQSRRPPFYQPNNDIRK